MWRSALAFGAVCGLIGEAFEVARLYGSGGIALPLSLRLTLAVLYAALGALLYLLGTLVAGSAKRRLVVASGLFLAALLVPWLNFDYLPRTANWRSVAGSAAAVLMSFVAAALAARTPRCAAAAVIFSALAINVWARPVAPPPLATSRLVAPPDGPNVVLVLIDTLRADHLGAYGYDRPTSPNLDRLAAESIVFERAIAQASWTKPSIASLLTGLYVHNHGVIRSRDALGGDLPYMAEELRRRGYRTAGFSGNPWITPEFRFDRGFDTFASGRPMGPQLTVLYKALRRLQRLLRRIGVDWPVARAVFFAVAEEKPSNAERDARMTGEVLEWLRQPPQRPFFLYVHLIGPHDPYDPPAEFVAAFQRQAGPFPTNTPPRVESVFVTAQPMDDMEHRKLVAQYDASIAYIDTLLGQLVNELQNQRLVDDTLLIVTSDHGEEFYEHGNWRHGNQLYDEVIRVPLVVRLPGRVEAQRRNDTAMLVDVLPTVMDVTGLTNDGRQGDGSSLFGEGRDGSPPVFAEHRWFEGGEYVSRMVQMGDLKFHRTRDEARDRMRDEAYNTAVDRGERRDLVREGGLSTEEMANLEALFEELDRGSVRAAPTVDGIDPQTRERLRLLGYNEKMSESGE